MNTCDDHPPAFKLDAHAAGHSDVSVEAHLRECATCLAYVTTSTEDARAFAATDDVPAFLEKVRARATRGSEDPRRKLPKLLLFAAPTLAAAAALLFVLRSPTQPLVAAPEAPLTATAPELRFKGEVHVAVIRDRSGTQERITTEVPIKPGDRIRAEVGVDHARPVLVGFLGKDGSWAVLVAPTELEAGTHLSEKAARFDDRPTEGWVIAGHPTDVERAKMSRTFDGVTIIPVVLEQ